VRWSIPREGQAGLTGTIELSALAAPRRDGLAWQEAGAWKGIAPARLDQKDQVVLGVENWQGPADCSAEVRAAWDADALYLDVRVRDRTFLTPTQPTFAEDGVELFLNTDLSPRINENNHQLFLAPRTTTSEGFAYNPDESLPGLRGVGQAADDSYRIALRIPWKELKVSPQPGTAVGIDVAVDDKDDPKKRRKLQVTWAGTRDNYRDPGRFGHLLLVAE
jgi:hypothetical protein